MTDEAEVMANFLGKSPEEQQKFADDISSEIKREGKHQEEMEASGIKLAKHSAISLELLSKREVEELGGVSFYNPKRLAELQNIAWLRGATILGLVNDNSLQDTAAAKAAIAAAMSKKV